uniref:F-box domain-containing protein n=1 Tax=Leersia perrieri TaxID=77586 RepID=A0A0D9X512_9ORYZ
MGWEDVLCDIVSHLTLKEAARASVLSSSWRNAWRHYPDLTFSHSIFPRNIHVTPSMSRQVKLRLKEQTERFIHIVNNILQRHSGLVVKSLKIKFNLYRVHQVHIDQWVGFAIKSKAADLILDLRPLSLLTTNEPYVFPFNLFMDKQQCCIQVLRLNFCSFKPPLEFSCLNNLKTLDLRSVDIIEVDVDSLLTNCICLEYLRIEKCDKLINLVVSHPLHSLQSLVVRNCRSLQRIDFLVASHPLHCLQSLVVRDCRSLQRIDLDAVDLAYFVVKAPRVVDAWIGIHSPIVVLHILSELADMLPDLQKLCLHLSSTENEMLFMPGNTSMFMHLRDLDLRILHWKNLHMRELLLLGHVLDLAPVMQRCNLNLHEKEPYDAYCPLMKRLPTSFHTHLKEVMITGFVSEWQYASLAAHFLFNATSFQTMEITSMYKPMQCGEKLLVHRDFCSRIPYVVS